MLKKLFFNLLTIFLIIGVIFSNSLFAMAAKTDDEKEIEEVETVKEEKLSARSPHVILLDMETGTILFKRKSTARVYPASLTKIMTAILALENGNLEDVVEAKETALSNISEGDSKLGIIKGERLSVRQLLYAMMLTSAADASNVLAEHTSGSIEKFVEAMNKKAAELGMKGTNFTNPIGNHDERHYTTAKDMAKLCMYAMKNESFCEIVKTATYSIPATEKCDKERKLINKNYLVSTGIRNDYYYKYATGLKTGYTKEAKSCIAASAQKGEKKLLCLIFKADTEDGKAISFTDCKNLFEFVFNNYTPRRIVTNNTIVTQTKIHNTRRSEKVILKTAKGIDALRHKDEDEIKITFKDKVKGSVNAPVKKDDKIGTREYFVNGESVGSVDLVADKDYKFDALAFIVNKTVSFFTSPWLFVVILFVIIILINAERHRRKMLRIKRRENREKRNKELRQKIMK